MIMNGWKTGLQRPLKAGGARRVGAWPVFLLPLTALVAPAVRPLTQGVASGSPVAAPAMGTPLCLGRHDLIVDGVSRGSGTILNGTTTYDSICIRNGGVLVIDKQATLRVGVFYLDSVSSVAAAGLPGGVEYGGSHCPSSGTGTSDGDPGATLLIQARRALIAGTITATGGAGFNGRVEDSCPAQRSGNGGKGGSVTIEAATLVLTGTVEASGGAGGNGSGGNDGTTGHGGAGGTITVSVGPSRPAPLTTYLNAKGGQDGKTTVVAQSGVVKITRLTAAALSVLPPVPPPLVAILGRAPLYHALRPVGLFAQGMACGQGDLIVLAGTKRLLDGVHAYAHVCINGLLSSTDGLILRARTIMVARGGRLRAVGLATAGGEGATGRYETAGACASDRRPPHAGVAGSAGTGFNGGAGVEGGAGGGLVTLLAPRILLMGTLSSRGSDGKVGYDSAYGSPSSGDSPPDGGSSGGSGGGILIVADVLQAAGTISARGGLGGQPGSGSIPAGNNTIPAIGPVGGPGCIKVFANTVRTPLGSVLDVSGPLLIGRPLPSDLPPATSPGS